MSRAFPIGWLLAASLTLRAETVPQVQYRTLDPRIVVQVPIAPDRVTTLYFPGPIAGIEAAFVTADGDPPARFQYSFQAGQRYLSLRSTFSNLAANMNVVFANAIYAFELIPSSDPVYAMVFTTPPKASTNRVQVPHSVGSSQGTNRVPATTNSSVTATPTLPRNGDALRVPQASIDAARALSAVPYSSVLTSPAPVTNAMPVKPAKRERWWNRMHIPYLLNVEINTTSSEGE